MTVLQALDRYYERMAARGEVVRPGWSREAVGVVLELAPDGALLRAERWLDDRGKPRTSVVPKWFTRSGTGSTPYFLWDNAAYVLGLGAKDPGKTARDHAAFKALHLAALAEEDDPGLRALRCFLERWCPEQGSEIGLDDRQLTQSIAFRLQGEDGLIHAREAARPHVERLRAEGASTLEGFCLVRGERLPLVRLHPKIKGVDGTASAEVPLVSFNADAFTSYGKEQGLNAPTSETAAFQYGAALNALLTRGGPNRLRVGDASIAFWADASAVEEATKRDMEDWFAAEFGEAAAPKGATDEQQAAKVREALYKVRDGRAQAPFSPEVQEKVSFYVLGLSPNAARLSVRYWLENSFRDVAKALEQHRRDIALEPPPWNVRPPSAQYLLRRTVALQDKTENIPNGLAGETLRAILTGAPYPRTLMAAAILRLRAGDDASRGWHAAALKACLNRAHRFAHPGTEEPISVSLDPDNPSPAYQLGRLFAVLESAQYAALGRVNASVVDRYYGAASSTPARVFGALLRGAQVHISDAQKRGRGLWISAKLTEIIARLPAELPTSLMVEDQARFAIGYYHERSARPTRAGAEAGADAGQDDPDQETN